jgi:biotin operon repressor
MRILTVLEYLQSRDAISGQELADRLEVSLRTVQRYIVRLQDLGVPVVSTRGPGGSYRLRSGYRMPPVMFGLEEAFAVALGLDALAMSVWGTSRPPLPVPGPSWSGSCRHRPANEWRRCGPPWCWSGRGGSSKPMPCN